VADSERQFAKPRRGTREEFGFEGREAGTIAAGADDIGAGIGGARAKFGEAAAGSGTDRGFSERSTRSCWRLRRERAWIGVVVMAESLGLDCSVQEVGSSGGRGNCIIQRGYGQEVGALQRSGLIAEGFQRTCDSGLHREF